MAPIEDLYRRHFGAVCPHCEIRTLNGALYFPEPGHEMSGLSCTKCSCLWTMDGILVQASDTFPLGHLEKLGDDLKS